MYSTCVSCWKSSCVAEYTVYDQHRHGSKSLHMHKPLFTVSLLPPCPLCKFQGWPVKAQSSIKTIMLPDFYDGKGSSTDALRVERIHTLSPLSIFFIFPLPSSHSLRLSPLLCLCLLSASSRHIHIIWWEREGQRAWGGDRDAGLFFSLFVSLCMTFSASFNINSGDSEIWMLRIQTETAGTLTALVLVSCLHVLKC